MQEKRVSVRTSLLGVTAKVSKDGKSWEEIAVRDISDGGMGFTAAAEYPKGTKLALEGEASDFARRKDISCNAEVIFCGPSGNGGYQYGMKFLNMTKEQHTDLSIFIEMIVTQYPGLLLD